MADTKISALPAILSQNLLQASVLPVAQSSVSSSVALGDVQQYIGLSRRNWSTAAQTPAAATRTYITGSALSPDGAYGTHRVRIGSMWRWKFNMTKTGAGSAASTIDVAIGTTASTADPAVLSFTKPAGTAVADEGWVEIDVLLRGPLSAAGIFSGEMRMSHNLQNTGHMVIPCMVQNVISGAFDVTTAALWFGICLTSGAADAITIQQMTVEALNL